jgi:hypothetical protein
MELKTIHLDKMFRFQVVLAFKNRRLDSLAPQARLDSLAPQARLDSLAPQARLDSLAPQATLQLSDLANNWNAWMDYMGDHSDWLKIVHCGHVITRFALEAYYNPSYEFCKKRIQRWV